MELSFGEQIKVILKRKNMTIQDLAELYETYTGSKMTRQNLSQRLKRDNFPEQDMRALAAMLGFDVTIRLTPTDAPVLPSISKTKLPITKPAKPAVLPSPPILGDVNPLTGKEYLTNTVRQHPEQPNYIQVYDQSTHSWTDVSEEYFWEFQATKKELLGSDYQEPIVI